MQHWPWYLLIDAAVEDVERSPGDLTERAFKIRARINRWMGLQVGVGSG